MSTNALMLVQFDALIAPLMTDGLDLPTAIERLENSVQLMVPSQLGWSLQVRVEGAYVTMTSIPRGTVATDVRASLRIPLSAFLAGGLDGAMVFYASKPHAFRRFADAFVPTLGPAVCRSRLDQDLNPTCTAGLGGLHLMSAISQAIKVLVGRGDTADAARVRLQTSALIAHQTLTQCARGLLPAR